MGKQRDRQHTVVTVARSGDLTIPFLVAQRSTLRERRTVTFGMPRDKRRRVVGNGPAAGAAKTRGIDGFVGSILGVGCLLVLLMIGAFVLLMFNAGASSIPF